MLFRKSFKRLPQYANIRGDNFCVHNAVRCAFLIELYFLMCCTSPILSIKAFRGGGYACKDY